MAKKTTDEPVLNRRDLFKLGAGKTAEAAGRLAGIKAAWAAENWLRPPFALAELAFELTCTRCDKCIEACPFDVLFKLPARFGLQVAGTPAMDLLHRGCHMCEDWPCVAACEPKALAMAVAQVAPNEDGSQPPPKPKLATITINTKTCLPYLGPECGACAHVCPVPGALEWEDGLRPVINQDVCTGCALCREACILDPEAVDVSAISPNDDDEEAAVAS
jgi:ferredoxin-type protein NapG